MRDVVTKLDEIFLSVHYELAIARETYTAFNSAHEGYAILLEEVDELWTEVKKRPDAVDKAKMRAEAIQVAAMALRFIVDVCE